MFTKCVERNHEAILKYFYNNPLETPEKPDWFTSSVNTDEGDVVVTIEGLETVTVPYGDILVYDDTNKNASVMTMEEFVDEYQRVDD